MLYRPCHECIFEKVRGNAFPCVRCLSEEMDHFVPKIPKCRVEIDIMPTKVIFNNPATIIFWSDNTKTVVKATHEPYDKEKGIAMAYMKKIFGNKSRYYTEMQKMIERYSVEENVDG